MTPISWDRISRAVQFYMRHGFKYIEAPWFINQDAGRLACPPGREVVVTHLGSLPASGEQSFYHMMTQDCWIEEGTFVCVTPCFRDEPQLDKYHLNGFMKVELIDTRPGAGWEYMATCAYTFMHAEGITCHFGSDGTSEYPDLVSPSGVELGSYGIRKTSDGFVWAYGTGLAEPRFSVVLDELK